MLGFRSSDNLGSAYGIAVTGTMVITTLLALIVARYQWRWSRLAVVATGIGLLTVDLAFFSANIIKVESGGWFPLALGLVVFVLMTTWRRGRELVVREMQQGGLALAPFIVNLRDAPAAAGGRHGGVPHRRCRRWCRIRCCTTSSTTRCCTSATCC